MAKDLIEEYNRLSKPDNTDYGSYIPLLEFVGSHIATYNNLSNTSELTAEESEIEKLMLNISKDMDIISTHCPLFRALVDGICSANQEHQKIALVFYNTYKKEFNPIIKDSAFSLHHWEAILNFKEVVYGLIYQNNSKNKFQLIDSNEKVSIKFFNKFCDKTSLYIDEEFLKSYPQFENLLDDLELDFTKPEHFKDIVVNNLNNLIKMFAVTRQTEAKAPTADIFISNLMRFMAGKTNCKSTDLWLIKQLFIAFDNKPSFKTLTQELNQPAFLSFCINNIKTIYDAHEKDFKDNRPSLLTYAFQNLEQANFTKLLDELVPLLKKEHEIKTYQDFEKLGLNPGKNSAELEKFVVAMNQSATSTTVPQVHTSSTVANIEIPAPQQPVSIASGVVSSAPTSNNPAPTPPKPPLTLLQQFSLQTIKDQEDKSITKFSKATEKFFNNNKNRIITDFIIELNFNDTSKDSQIFERYKNINFLECIFLLKRGTNEVPLIAAKTLDFNKYKGEYTISLDVAFDLITINPLAPELSQKFTGLDCLVNFNLISFLHEGDFEKLFKQIFQSTDDEAKKLLLHYVANFYKFLPSKIEYHDIEILNTLKHSAFEVSKFIINNPSLKMEERQSIVDNTIAFSDDESIIKLLTKIELNPFHGSSIFKQVLNSSTFWGNKILPLIEGKLPKDPQKPSDFEQMLIARCDNIKKGKQHEIIAEMLDKAYLHIGDFTNKYAKQPKNPIKEFFRLLAGKRKDPLSELAQGLSDNKVAFENVIAVLESYSISTRSKDQKLDIDYFKKLNKKITENLKGFNTSLAGFKEFKQAVMDNSKIFSQASRSDKSPVVILSYTLATISSLVAFACIVDLLVAKTGFKITKPIANLMKNINITKINNMFGGSAAAFAVFSALTGAIGISCQNHIKEEKSFASVQLINEACTAAKAKLGLQEKYR